MNSSTNKDIKTFSIMLIIKFLSGILVLATSSLVLARYLKPEELHPPLSKLGVYKDYHEVHNGLESVKGFYSEWTVQVMDGEEMAKKVAMDFGYTYLGPVRGHHDAFRFIKPSLDKVRRTPSEAPATMLEDERVGWVEQLFEKYRVKRTAITQDDDKVEQYISVVSSGDKSSVSTAFKIEVQQAIKVQDNKGFDKKLFNDELWARRDTRRDLTNPRLNLNVLPLYEMGITGLGIRVCVLDDGLEHNHTDLIKNYDPEISWDYNDGDSDPMPRKDGANSNSHGTRCAGEIAMTANNSKCGVGIAFEAHVGGVRMLDGGITDRIEGEALSHAVDKVDIYLASWGPSDDGRTVEGPGRLALRAIKKGITEGRHGKGAIYVWANGNGGGNFDNCNCDGYASSVYTVSVASTSEHGKFPLYGETCSSTLTTAYSSKQKIVTTDTGDSCTLHHTGTSAAAPLAAGIVALALQANPDLTWRDVQHLIVWTSDHEPLVHNAGWQTNGVGLHYNNRFGFGLIDAGKMVASAIEWKKVPEKTNCRFQTVVPEMYKGIFFTKQKKTVKLFVNQKCEVNYLEHVEVILNLKSTRRGAVEIYLASPEGTTVQLLSRRLKDNSQNGFTNWPLMSVATWGEDPHGVWTIELVDLTDEDNFFQLGSTTLKVYGTKNRPNHMEPGSVLPPDYKGHFAGPAGDDDMEVYPCDFDEIPRDYDVNDSAANNYG